MKAPAIIGGILGLSAFVYLVSNDGKEETPTIPEYPRTDSETKLNFDVSGCRSSEVMDKLRKLGGYQHDMEAANNLFREKLRQGECRNFRKDDSVMVMDISVWHSAAQIREKGSPESYWVQIEAIEIKRPKEARRPEERK